MDALDVLDVVTKVRRVVDLVLEHDPGNPISNKIHRLHLVVRSVQVVVVERPRYNCEHQITPGFHVGIFDHLSPHLDGVSMHRIF